MHVHDVGPGNVPVDGERRGWRGQRIRHTKSLDAVPNRHGHIVRTACVRAATYVPRDPAHFVATLAIAEREVRRDWFDYARVLWVVVAEKEDAHASGRRDPRAVDHLMLQPHHFQAISG